MGRNAETELFDDIVDLFAPYDHVSDIKEAVARDVVDLVKHRLVTPDEKEAIMESLAEASQAIDGAVRLLNGRMP